MPVMIVGADTDPGRRIIRRLLSPEREVRAFVTDPDEADELRQRGAKVALGDVSDDSHLASACLNCFSVVLVENAATDERERAFAATPAGVMGAWASAAETAGVSRVIWVIDGDPPPVSVPEVAAVTPQSPDLVEAVYRLDATRKV
jgi:putative NADH-flavin reductase